MHIISYFLFLIFLINNSIQLNINTYLCINTIKDNSIIHFINNLNNNTIIINNTNIYINKIECSKLCQNFITEIQKFSYIIGYWDDRNFLSCVSSSISINGVFLFNIYPIDSICYMNIFTSYLSQNLAFSFNYILYDHYPFMIIYDESSKIGDILDYFKYIYIGTDSIKHIYNLDEYNNNEINSLSNSRSVIFILDSENNGLTDFLNSVPDDVLEVILIGFFNENNVPSTLSSIKHYIISPYFTTINNMLLKVNNYFPTFQLASLYTYFEYITIISGDLNSNNIKSPLYSIFFSYRKKFESPFGSTFMNSNHYLSHDTYVGKFKDNSIEIINKIGHFIDIVNYVKASPYYFKKNVDICDFSEYISEKYEFKYIAIITTEDKVGQLLYIAHTTVFQHEVYKVIHVILIFTNISNIPNDIFSTKIDFILIDLPIQDKITVMNRNNGSVKLYNINTYEGGDCSNIIINVFK